MQITEKQLAAFQAVLTVGTATMAAKVLNTSQPAVTRALKQLEDATRLTLFDRAGGRLRPTPDALALFREVEENFRGVDRIARAAQNIRRSRLGYLRVACLPAFSQGFLAGAIERFRRESPDVSIAVRALLAPEVIAGVRSYDYDIGIAAYEVDEPDLVSQRFTTVNEVVVLPPDHPLGAKAVVSFEDLRDEVIVLLAANDPYRTRLETMLRQRRVDIVQSIEIETTLGACALVAQGVGVGVVNPISALDFIGRGLVMRRFEAPLPFCSTLIRPQSDGREGAVDKFTRALIAQRDEAVASIETILARGSPQ